MKINTITTLPLFMRKGTIMPETKFKISTMSSKIHHTNLYPIKKLDKPII